MSNVDISPEAVEAHRVRLLVEEGRTYTTDLIFALRAALTAAEMERSAAIINWHAAQTLAGRRLDQIEAAASDMRERAVEACEAERAKHDEIEDGAGHGACADCAAAIRALPLTKGGSDAAE